MTGGGSPLALPADLTVGAAASVHALLRERLAAVAEGGRLEVDLGAVTEIDTSGLQLLLAARREATRRGLTLDLVGPGESVLRLVQLLRLDLAADGGPGPG